MQINLKQPEIEAALKGYITKQGISLEGKTITVAFTAGRKNSGVSAEVNIEEADMEDEDYLIDTLPVEAPKMVIQLQAEVIEEPRPTEVPVSTETVKTSSLFG